MAAAHPAAYKNDGLPRRANQNFYGMATAMYVWIMGIKKAHAIMLSNNRCSVGMDYHHFCNRCKDTHIFETCKEKGGKIQNYCYISE